MKPLGTFYALGKKGRATFFERYKTKHAKPSLHAFAPLVLALLSGAASLHASIVTVPPGLTNGDRYRLIFVTADLYTATSTDIGYYNDVVTAEADSIGALSALDTTWSVIGSTAAVSAIDNIGADPGVPIYDFSDHLIASDASTGGGGLFHGASLDDGLVYNENAFIPGFTGVWTGASVDGTARSGFSLGSATVVSGSTGTNSGFWIAHTNISSSTELNLYAISGILTVGETAAPEPASSGLAAMSIAALFAIARWRRGIAGNKA